MLHDTFLANTLQETVCGRRMCYNQPMNKIRIAGRYLRKPLGDFLRSIHQIGIASRKPTRAERVLKRMEYSLNNDFRAGFSPREHGFDCHSITTRFRAAVEAAAVRERMEQEGEYLREALQAVEAYRSALEVRLAELGADRMPTILRERQAMIREARARSAQ